MCDPLVLTIMLLGGLVLCGLALWLPNEDGGEPIPRERGMR
jgi:hypothetical protein